MSDVVSATVLRSVTVPLVPAEAFVLFTERLGDFKPPEHNMLPEPIAATVLEPRVGGAIVDRGIHGSECRWARVLVFDPPDRLVFTWDIGPTWQVETDLERVSEVEVRFIAAGDAATRVEVEHRHLDRHGLGWKAVHDGIADEQGWRLYLDRFALLAGEAAH